MKDMQIQALLGQYVDSGLVLVECEWLLRDAVWMIYKSMTSCDIKVCTKAIELHFMCYFYRERNASFIVSMIVDLGHLFCTVLFYAECKYVMLICK